MLEPALTSSEVKPLIVALKETGLSFEVMVVGATKVTAPPNVTGPVVVMVPPKAA